MKLNILFVLPLWIFATSFLVAQSDTIAVVPEVEIIGVVPEKQHVPGAAFTIKTEQIRFSNSATSADLLMQSGKVFVQKSQSGGGSPVLRGFEANKVLIMVDGIRLNNFIFRGGHLQNILRMDNFAMEKITVALGPQSLNYGSDALGGVMVFDTEKPKFLAEESPKNLEVNGNGLFRYGTAASEITQNYNLRFRGKNWGAITSFSMSILGDLRQGRAKNPFNKEYPNYFDRNYYVKNIDGKDSVFTNVRPEKQVTSGYTQYNVMQKFSFRTKDLLHEVGVLGTTTSNVPRYDRLTEFSNGLPKFAEWYYGPEKWAMLNYGLTFEKPTVLYDHFTVRLAGQYFEESRISRRLNSTNRRHQIEKVKAISFNGNAFKSLGKHTLEYGWEGIWNGLHSTAFMEKTTSSTQSPTETRYPDGNNTLKSVSVFLTDNYWITSNFLLSGGVRYQYNDMKSVFLDTTFFPFPFKEAIQKNAAWSGKLATTYKNKYFNVMVSGSTAYRIPNIDDMSKVFESAGGNLIIPNPNLKPEYAKTAEIQIFNQNTQRFQFSVGSFFTRLDNAIQLGNTTFNGADSVLYDGTMSAVFSNQNRAKANITGAYAGLSVNFGHGFNAYGNFTYTKGMIVTETPATPLDHIPPFFGNIGIGYYRNKWKAQCYGLFNGTKSLKNYSNSGEDNLNYATPNGMPGWFTLNLKASWEAHQHVTLMGGIENVLDTNYRVFASGVSSSGRNVFFAIRGNF